MTHPLLSAALALVAGAALVGCGEPPKKPAPPPKAVEVLTVQERTVRDTGEYLGSLLSRGSVVVQPQVTGYVKTIHVKPGQKVKAGDPLVDIDAREEQAALESANAQVRSAQASLALARQTLARTQALYDEGLAPAQELDRVRADVQAAEAATQATSSSVSQRQVLVGFHAVRAAVPGTVGEVPVRKGDAVTPQTVLLTIADAEVLELSVALPAARARTLKPDSPVEILDPAGAVLVKTQLFYTAPQADPQTQLVVVKAVFDNAVGLRPSELVRARIVFGESQALAIPALAAVRQSGQAFVFAVGEKDGATVVTRRPIQTGRLIDEGGAQLSVVTSGLNAGDRIAISALQALRDGAVIKPLAPGQAPSDAKPGEAAKPEGAPKPDAPAPAAPAPAASPPSASSPPSTR